MNMPYRGAHKSADFHPLSSIRLTKGDIATGKLLLRACVNPKISDEYVQAQAWASCTCANSIILDLMDKARKPELFGTRPTIVVVNETSEVTAFEVGRDPYGGRGEIWSIATMTTPEYTELREALMAAVERGHILYTQPPPGVLGNPLAMWGGTTINGWYAAYKNYRHRLETITQFIERQTKPTTKE